ncbi:dihydrodipicolinate synthase family protein [Kaistia sp. 32K]|uniref:dihydrodipicolinate synthase family protein n=1 Tax=Kaistia sp. 32K TaxID=2795690 RepID=UPI0019163FE0|nr:dihydrodipicolinate synthase family protein [Kaistia sp. 32K]BCP53732.1 dihydrodipicolinate synthase family protein [Kaistia sp. 32K]
MKTDAVTPADLARSVLSVPPLPRGADGAIHEGETRRLVDWLHAGGVTTYMFGGNANLYNIGVGEFATLLDVLERVSPADGWVIPSIGADYGKACDQVDLLRERAFPTAMLLPLTFPATPAGVATGLRKLADRYGKPLIAYVKNEGYIGARDLAALIADGAVCTVKYAVVRKDPAEDPLLSELLSATGSGERIISGIGERPVIDHVTRFGLNAFTSGSVCVAPHLSTAILKALKRGDTAEAAALREHFIPLEDLRDRHSPIRVLHAAVKEAGIAETGPMSEFLSNLDDPALLAEIRAAAETLRARSLERAETSAVG